MIHTGRRGPSARSGFGLVETIVAIGILGIVMAGTTELTRLMTSSQASFASVLDLATIQEDLGRAMTSPKQCMQRFGSVQGTLTGSDSYFQARLSSDEVIGAPTNLQRFKLHGLALKIAGRAELGAIGPNRLWAYDLVLSGASTSLTGAALSERRLPTLHLLIDSSGRIVDCNASSAAASFCPRDEIAVSNGSQSAPTCLTMAQLVSKLCPAGHVAMSQGPAGISCYCPFGSPGCPPFPQPSQQQQRVPHLTNIRQTIHQVHMDRPAPIQVHREPSTQTPQSVQTTPAMQPPRLAWRAIDGQTCKTGAGRTGATINHCQEVSAGSSCSQQGAYCINSDAARSGLLCLVCG